MAVTLTLPDLADHMRLERDAVVPGTPTHTIVADLLMSAARNPPCENQAECQNDRGEC